MKITVYGKHGGSFVGDDGKEIKFYKVSCITPVPQKEGDYIVCGYSAEKIKIDRSIFESLPDDKESYTDGLLCDAEFDYKGNIVTLDLV